MSDRRRTLADDSCLKDAVVCYDPVDVKDDNDERVLGQARWNETLVSVTDDAAVGPSLPAWKWQLWVETRGEVEVQSTDGTLKGFVWPRKKDDAVTDLIKNPTVKDRARALKACLEADQTKLLLTLEGLTAAEAERVRAVMNRRFAQFRFDCALEGMSSTRTGHDLLARGPWHLSARERPAMDVMRTFAEGAAAVFLAANQGMVHERAKKTMVDLAEAAEGFRAVGDNDEYCLCRDAAQVVAELAAMPGAWAKDERVQSFLDGEEP